MITIVKQPYICSLSRNPIDFTVQTDMYFNSVIVHPSITIEVRSLPIVGTTYNMQWNNPETGDLEQFQFVVKNGAAAANYAGPFELPGTGFTGTLADFVDIVVFKLKNARLFNANYTIEALPSNQFIITAREALEALKINYTSNQVSGYLTIESLLNDFNTPEIRDQYSMRAQIFFEKEYESGNFEHVSTIDCVVDNDSRAFIDLSETLNAEIESTWDEYPVPWKQENKYVAPNLKRFYVKFIENWADEPEVISTVSDILLVHWGGVNTDEHMMGDALILNAAKGDFLTWFQSGKQIARNQSDWLAWMNRDLEYIFDIHCVITTNVDTYDIVKHDITIKPFETVVFNTGFDANNLQDDVPEGEIIKKWTWYVGIDENKVSSDFTYYLDANCIRKVICFFNSYGIPETFNTSGEWTESVSIASEIASRAGSFNLNSLFPQNFIFDSTHGTSYNAVTTYLDNESARRLKSMINSVIAFVQEQSIWIPAIIMNSKTRILKINDFQQLIELEILKANEDDRASFIGAQIDVVPFIRNGIEWLDLVSNGIEIQTYGPLELISGTMFSGGTVVETFVWDAGLKKYSPANFIQTEGEYRIEGTITGVDGTEYKIKKILRYQLREMKFVHTDTGTIGIFMRGSAPTAEVVVDWGDGTIEAPIYFSASDTNFPHTYTATGRKFITLRKPYFDDVIAFGTYNNIGRIEWARMKNLERILYWNGPGGNVYLSGLSKLKVIDLRDALISSISLGYQKHLESVTLFDLALTEETFTELFKELWKYRKLYVNVPGVYMSIPVFATPAEVTAILNGTGAYAGEGLISDYGWTVIFI